MNILMDPSEPMSLVLQSDVQSPVAGDFLGCQETERGEPVVDANDNNWVPYLHGRLDHEGGIELRIAVAALPVAAAVHPDQNGKV